MSEDKKKKGLLSSLSQLQFVQKLKSIKHIEIIVVVLFVLVLLLICFSGSNAFSFLSTNKTENTENNSIVYYTSTSEYVNSLETKLKKILSSIEGAGNVEVMISVEGSSEITFATDEVITTSGQSVEKEIKIILVQNGDVSQPIVTSEKLPQINGVVVVSSGAKDTKVKLQLFNAVETLLKLDNSKIQVLNGK